MNTCSSFFASEVSMTITHSCTSTCVAAEADAGRLVHRIGHVGDQPAQAIIKDADRTRDRAQSRVGVLQYRQQCHDSFSKRRAHVPGRSG